MYLCGCECKIQWENFHQVTFACYWKDPVRGAIEVKQQQEQQKNNDFEALEMKSSHRKRAQSTKREKKETFHTRILIMKQSSLSS